MTRCLAAIAVLLCAGDALAEKPKLVVLALTVPKELDAATAAAMDDAIASEAGRRGYFEAISSREVAVLLGLERQKQLLGCAEDSTSCLAELSGALGARFILSGSLARIGAAWQLSLQMQDSQKTQTVGRSTRIAKDVTSLRGLLPWMLAEATATPVPPPPSKVLPIVLISSGALLVVAGGFVGVQALQREAALQRELERGKTLPGLLAPAADYQADETSLRWQKNGSLLGVGIGAAAVGLGIYLWPPDPMRGAFVLVPTGNGVLFAGEFP